jgi:hypothetical protein
MGGQRGMSFWSILILLAVVGFLLTIAFRLAPAYINNYAVKSIIDKLPSTPGIGQMSKLEVQKLLQNEFDVNRVDVIKAQCRAHDPGDCVRITRQKDVMVIDANYEVRTPVMANVDAVVKFSDNTVEIPIQGE